MHRLHLLTLPLLIFYAAVACAAEPRFSGSASLDKPATAKASANGRFSISADLRPAALTKNTGRFALNAKLQPDLNSINATCEPVGDELFKNGFE